jgi:hypothetical protein
MRGRGHDDWDDAGMDGSFEDEGAYADRYDDGGYAGQGGYDAPDDDYGLGDDDERGLVLQQDESLVGVSSIVTQHGTPILSYTRTMNRFYTSRKQRLSLGRHRCEVCGDRIRFWSFETPTGSHTHDGCYERLAWMWTNVYAQQQRLAAEGRLD